MTRTITDIRPVGIAPHLTLIADVKEDNCLLGYSVTIDQLTSDELITYAVTDPAHIAKAAWQIEAEAQAADANDYQNTISGALEKPVFGSAKWFDEIEEVQY